MEAASSTSVAVTPGVAHNHPGVAKAWCKITMSGGTPTLGVNYNVDSITDNGTGLLTVNFGTDFSSANYVMVGSTRAQSTSGGGVIEVSVSSATAPTASACRVQFHVDGGAVTDSWTEAYLVFYGDQS